MKGEFLIAILAIFIISIVAQIVWAMILELLEKFGYITRTMVTGYSVKTVTKINWKRR